MGSSASARSGTAVAVAAKNATKTIPIVVAGAGDLVDYASFKRVPAWLERGLQRPAVQRGIEIPKKV